MCCQSFSPSEGDSASQVGRWDLKCSMSGAPEEPGGWGCWGCLGRSCWKGFQLLGLHWEKNGRNSAFLEGERGNQNSQERRSLSRFPGCFIGLNVLGVCLFCVWERNTEPSYTHPVKLSTLVLFDLIKWLFSVLAVTGWGCEHDKVLNGERASETGSFRAQSSQHYLVEWRKMVTEGGQVSAGLFSKILCI